MIQILSLVGIIVVTLGALKFNKMIESSSLDKTRKVRLQKITIVTVAILIGILSVVLFYK